MNMKTKILICGAGGFIGSHFTSRMLNKREFDIVCVDIKPIGDWFQIFDECQNYSLDLKSFENCKKVTKNVEYIYNFACNMGGMGFIENNKAECMLSVLINTNLLRAAVQNKSKKYLFTSSACVYNASKQKTTFVESLKEDDAYPADPEDGYGWEKLFSERMCRHFTEDFNIETRVVRYHNVYGPLGTFDGGREKAPAAICRKIALAKLNNQNEIEVWGDGEQTRSFMFIDDCLEGTEKVFNSRNREPYNVGSDEQVSINQLVDYVEEIAEYKVTRKYLLDKPKGVRGRSSNNSKIINDIGWQPTISLKHGLKKTYDWIFNELKNGRNNTKFTKS